MRPAKYPYLESDGFLAFAHRGGRGGGPENTLPAFQHAVDLGYRYLETDVHATRDGVLLAFHDETLDRVTDGTGRICDLDYQAVAKVRVGGREPIPLLEDLLGAWPDLRINIDPKLDHAAVPLVAAIKRCGAIERVCVSSFSSRRTAWIRGELGARLCTGTGPLSTARLWLSSLSGPLAPVWDGFAEGCAQIPTDKWGIPLAGGRLVARAHELGLQVHVWTIDDRAEMNRLIDIGVDGLMTDELEVLKSVLVARGLWR